MNELFWILIKILLKFIAKSPNNNKPALVQIMAWFRWSATSHYSNWCSRDSLTYICGTRGRWVNSSGSRPINNNTGFVERQSWPTSSVYHSSRYNAHLGIIGFVDGFATYNDNCLFQNTLGWEQWFANDNFKTYVHFPKYQWSRPKRSGWIDEN